MSISYSAASCTYPALIIDPMSSLNNFNIESFFDELPELLNLEITAPSVYPTSMYATDHAPIKMDPLSTITDPYATQQQPPSPSDRYTSSSSSFLEPISMPHFNPFCHLDSTAIESSYTACAHGNVETTPTSTVNHHLTSTLPPSCQDSPAQAKPKQESEKERLRTRQRGYERAYRKRKRESFKKQRRNWIELETKLRKIQASNNRSVTVPSKVEPTSFQSKVEKLKMEAKALTMDVIYLRSVKAWSEAAKLRNYRKSSELMNVALSAVASGGMADEQPPHPISTARFEFSW